MVQYANGDDPWIGLHHLKPCTHAACSLEERLAGWFWLDGSQSNFSNWDAGTIDPNEGTSCVRMKADTGVWGDKDCQMEFKFVCEMQALNGNKTCQWKVH